MVTSMRYVSINWNLNHNVFTKFCIQRGFSYYSTPREYVEVTDTVFVEKKLLEFQCSLALVATCIMIAASSMLITQHF